VSIGLTPSRVARRGPAIVVLLAIVLGGLAGCRRGAVFDRRREGRFGTVRIYAPTAAPRGLVFLFSDVGGWDDALDRAARSLSDDGAAVLGIDLPEYLRNLAASGDGCHYLISEVEDLSKRVQHDLGSAGYASPILAGIGAGGTLAYAALAQSPAATVAGAVSVDPAPALVTRVPLCAGAPSESVPGGGYRYEPAAKLPGWWRVSAPAGIAAGLSHLATLVEDGGSPAERLVAAVAATLPAAGVPPAATPLADLPLVELPAERAGNVFAVIYSGDGGWRDIDKQIGEQLAQHAVPVVGVDSLRYFWRAKTPEQVARDLQRIVDHYGTAWRTPSVALIGYSFGAGILPFAYNRLPATDRARVALLALLGVEHRAAFEFKLSGWLGSGASDEVAPVLPEVQRLPPGLLLCVYGEDEPDTLCRDPALSGAEIVRTAGGHHFDGDYRALAQRILDAVARRTRPPVAPP
jgi:type IV secretory pathway VirJ component